MHVYQHLGTWSWSCNSALRIQTTVFLVWRKRELRTSGVEFVLLQLLDHTINGPGSTFSWFAHKRANTPKHKNGFGQKSMKFQIPRSTHQPWHLLWSFTLAGSVQCCCCCNRNLILCRTVFTFIFTHIRTNSSELLRVTGNKPLLEDVTANRRSPFLKSNQDNCLALQQWSVFPS